MNKIPAFVPEAPPIETAPKSYISRPRVRLYPTLSFIRYACYGLATLVVISFLVTILVASLSYSGMAPEIREGMGLAALALGLSSSLIGHGVALILLLGFAEIIKLSVDVQQNTQEAAHYSRQTAISS